MKNLEQSNELISALLNKKPYKQEEVKSENVITSFFETGESKMELLQATSEESAIAKFVEKKGEGIHHIAFDVTNIHQELERLEKEGFKLITKVPKQGADNKLVAFLHPKSTNGVLIELCQEITE